MTVKGYTTLSCGLGFLTQYCSTHLRLQMNQKLCNSVWKNNRFIADYLTMSKTNTGQQATETDNLMGK